MLKSDREQPCHHATPKDGRFPSRSAFLLLLASLTVSFAAVMPACSSSDTHADTGGAGTGAGTGTGTGAGGSSTGGSSTGGSSTGGSGGSPQKPPECDEFTLPTALTSSQMADPESYQWQPDLNGLPMVSGSTGTGQKSNIFLFFVDSADEVGSYPVVPFTNYDYASSNTGAMNAEYDASAGYTHYAAVSGTVEITSKVSPHQTEGRLSNVRFDEVKVDAHDNATPVPNGKCRWLKEVTWNTKRPGGCAPFTDNACPAGQYCMPTNAIGDDGLCVTTGAKGIGEGCALVSDGKWDSDCAPGLRCAMFAGDIGETSYTCHQVCDVRSANPGCPSTQHCGGGYDVCLSVDFLEDAPMEGNEIDTEALVGQTCTQNPGAHYCGVDATPGSCVKDAGSTTSECRAYHHALSECPDGLSGGYMVYKSGIDLSSIFCIKAP